MANSPKTRGAVATVHLTVWGCSLISYLLLPYRVARVLALDYEALQLNLAEALPARVDQVELARATLLIMWGALPIWVVAVAGLLYRLCALRGWLRQLAQITFTFGGRSIRAGCVARWLRTTGTRPPPALPARRLAPLGVDKLICASRLRGGLVALPWWGRAALSLAVLASLAMACEPIAVALSVWYTAEVFWWVQWHDNVQPILNKVRELTPHLVVPALLFPGAVLTWLTLWPGGSGRLRRAIRWTSGGAAALVVGIFVLVSSVHGWPASMAPGQRELEATCGGCHVRSRPLLYTKTPAQWRSTVSRMRQLEGAKLSDSDAEDIIAFLVGGRSFSDQWTFRTRCQRCHGFESRRWERRTPSDWARIAARLARWSPYYYRKPIQDQVVAHLTRTRSDEAATLGLPKARYEAYQQVERTCAVCHSLSWNAQRVRTMSEARVQALVRRMVQKNTTGWSDARVNQLARDYRQLLRSSKTMDRLFPHDRPVRQEGLKW